MIYADAAFYADKFLRGRTPIIPLSEFDGWAQDASQQIDMLTFGRLYDTEEIPDEVAMATCEIAQVLFTQSQANSLTAVQSVSVPESISKTYRDQRNNPATQQQAISGAAFKWLHDVTVDFTPVLFRG